MFLTHSQGLDKRKFKMVIWKDKLPTSINRQDGAQAIITFHCDQCCKIARTIEPPGTHPASSSFDSEQLNQYSGKFYISLQSGATDAEFRNLFSGLLFMDLE